PIRVRSCRPIELEGLSSWDLDKTTWGGRVEAIGTVPMCYRCTGKVNGGGLVLAGKTDKSSWIGVSGVSFLVLQIGTVCIRHYEVELLLVAFDTELKVFHMPLDYDASCEHSKRDVKSKAFFDRQILIASRLPVDSKSVELLTFAPPMRYSPESMLVVAYWFLNPHCARHKVFNPLDVPIVCCLCLGDRNSLADVCRDLELYVDLPVVMVSFSFRALVDSDSFPSLRLLDPRFDPAEGSSSLSASSSRHLFYKLASNVLSQRSNPNNEPKFGRSCRSVLEAVVRGVGACGTVDMVAMVEGVRVGADNGRGATMVGA
nr:hypothetical protein [Tanacetum cinerariifolium]